MDILYIGHSSFLITAENGKRILLDPYDPKAYADNMTYLPFCGEADILLSSHKHEDHFTLDYVMNDPTIIDKVGEYVFDGIKIRGIETDHDKNSGSERGKNIVFVLDIDGLKVAHMGDLGHVLTDEQVKNIGKVDIILVPVGGFFTIDADEAHEVSNLLYADIIIPMHFSNEKCTFPIAPVESFTDGRSNVVRLGVTEFRPSGVPKSKTILVLEPKA